MAKRNWRPCRVCGAEHCNPLSSSICSECGAKESENSAWAAKKLAEEEKERAFAVFFSKSDEEKWRILWERTNNV